MTKRTKKHSKTKLGLEENIEAALSYVLGFITGIIFYIAEKDNEFIKFHAMQSIVASIVFTVIFYILQILVFWIPIIGYILRGLYNLVVMIIFIVAIFKAFKGKEYKMPIIGDMVKKIME